MPPLSAPCPGLDPRSPRDEPVPLLVAPTLLTPPPPPPPPPTMADPTVGTALLLLLPLLN